MWLAVVTVSGVFRAGMVEREECDGYGYEVDIWACGVVLYTMLVGFPPFWHRSGGMSLLFLFIYVSSIVTMECN